MALLDLIRKSRTYRSFDRSVRIGEARLASYVECARFSPSSMNLQMLKFRLVTDENECARVLGTLRWAAKLRDRQIPPTGHEPTDYIVVCTDSNIIASAESFQKDVGICAQSIMLAAAEDGFGGCMIASFSPATLAELLQLPQGIRPALVLALGRPDETVILTDAAEDGSVTYYREGDLHYVQKRALEDLILK